MHLRSTKLVTLASGIRFELFGEKYDLPTSEHVFMLLKALCFRDQEVIEELKKVSSPIVNIELEVNITDDLDIFHIEPGDYIGIDSELLNLKGKYRVMEYTVDISNNTVKINLGNCIFRKNNIVSYRY